MNPRIFYNYLKSFIPKTTQALKSFYTFILGLLLGSILCFVILEGDKILKTRITERKTGESIPLIDSIVIGLDTIQADTLKVDSVLLNAAILERKTVKPTIRKKNSQNFNPRDRGYVSDGQLQFSLKEDIVKSTLIIEGKNFSDDLTTALILDTEGNITAWYNSNQLRVRNKRIELNIRNINPGKYTIRIVADGAQFSRSFTKI